MYTSSAEGPEIMNAHAHRLASLPFQMLSNTFNSHENTTHYYEDLLYGMLRVVTLTEQETRTTQSLAIDVRTTFRMITYAYYCFQGENCCPSYTKIYVHYIAKPHQFAYKLVEYGIVYILAWSGWTSSDEPIIAPQRSLSIVHHISYLLS
jgi:hypothetical protein